MAVSKVLIICASIGFLSQVSNHPVKRRAVNVKYLLPSPLNINVDFDIKLDKNDIELFKISFMTTDDNRDEKIAYALTVKLDSKNTESNGHDEAVGYVYKANYVTFLINNAITVYFTVRDNNQLEISAQSEVICTIDNIDQITHFNITDKDGQDVKVKELNFIFH